MNFPSDPCDRCFRQCKERHDSDCERYQAWKYQRSEMLGRHKHRRKSKRERSYDDVVSDRHALRNHCHRIHRDRCRTGDLMRCHYDR